MSSFVKINLNGGLKRFASTLICFMMVLATFPMHMLSNTVRADGGVSIDLTLGGNKDGSEPVGNGSEVTGWMTGDLDTTKMTGKGDINITLTNDITVANGISPNSLPTMTTDDLDANGDGVVDEGVFPCFFDFTDSGNPDNNRFAGKTITIDGNGKTIKIDRADLFFLNLKDCRVILKNITIDGGWNGQTDGLSRRDSFIYVSQPSTYAKSELEIEEGATIQNCKNSSGSGGGIYVDNNGTVTMNDNATISDCSACNYGGGIYVYGSGKVTMNDTATISGCNDSSNGGGIYVDSTGTVTMNDNATISDCSACNYGGGIYVYGSGKVTMNDNATISGCTASSWSGGGIYVYGSGKVTMNDNATISGCTASSNGGGILNCGTVTMNDNATISGCTASSGDGGGIYFGSTGTVTMNGGKIIGCSAKRYGDAIYNNSGGTLNLPPKEFGFLTITLPEGFTNDAHNSGSKDVMGYEGIYNGGTIELISNYKIVFVDESNPPKQLNTGLVMGSIWNYIPVSNLNIIDGVRYVNKAGKETFVAVKDGKFKLTRDMVDSAKNGVITFKVKFGASADSDTVKYVASGHMVLDKNSKLTNYSGVNLPVSGLRKVPGPKNIIFDFCGNTIHHNDPNVPFIQGVPGKHITICNLTMDGSGCK